MSRADLSPTGDGAAHAPSPAKGRQAGEPPTDAAATAVRVRLLGCLADVLAESESPEQMLRGMLGMACEATGRQWGLLGRFDDRGRLVEQVATGAEAAAAAEVLQRARRERSATIAPLEGAPAICLVQPVGAARQAVLVLAEPQPEAPSDRDSLTLAAVVADVIGTRLTESEVGRGRREELDQLRFSHSSAGAAILASARLLQARLLIRALARHDDPVFLQGEEGTEIEDLARLLHATSPARASQPFVSFHPGAVPEHRLESELFGEPGMVPRPHERVASVAAAQGGTLLICEPERLPPRVQQRLVELLDDPAAQPRLVFAGARAPKKLAKAGELEEGLAERMGRHRVQVPSLRSYPSDVPSLVDLFLREMGAGPGGDPRAITDRAMQLLVNYRWPGNVRELRQVLETVVARAGAHVIQPKHLPAELRGQAEDLPRFMTLKQVEIKHLREVLGAIHSKREAAKMLGIAPSTLYDRLARYRIQA